MGLKTKIVLTKLSLKEPIGFKMMMSSLGENILEQKYEIYLFICIFSLSAYGFTQI